MSSYDRLLRLRHLHLAGWQRECLTWGSFVLAILLALTGLVSPWGILVLPAALAVAVKAHDLLLGRLPTAAQRFVGDLPGVGPSSDQSGRAEDSERQTRPPEDARSSDLTNGTPNGVPRGDADRLHAARATAARIGAARNGAARNGAARNGAARNGSNRPGAELSTAPGEEPTHNGNEPSVAMTEGS